MHTHPAFVAAVAELRSMRITDTPYSRSDQASSSGDSAFSQRRASGVPGGSGALVDEEDDIERCLNSICDNQSFLNSNRGPIDFLLEFLEAHFAPGRPNTGEGQRCCLSIYGAAAGGRDEARLTHTHERQYMCVGI